MEIFKVENLTFSYPNSQKPVLRNINFTANSGEFIVLCGQSGCGKSTLLRHLKTALSSHGEKIGRVLFFGKPIEQADLYSQASQIGFVCQSPDNQIVTDKVWHELAFGLESLGLDNGAIRRRTAEMAEFFGIQSLIDKSVCQLSGGQKQLLNLASVMAMQPSVLVLDEPCGQLDPIASGEFMSAVGKINRELGVTVILTEHRLDEALTLADRVLVMNNGSILCDCPPKNLGRQLQEKSDEMLLSLPAPTRIYLRVEGGDNCPLTVSEGRKWLEAYCESHGVNDIEFPKPAKHEGTPAIEGEGIWFRYSREGADILKGTSLKAYSGEFLGILGGNGAGKSTLLSVLSGCSECYRGRVKLFGEPIGGRKNSYRNLLGIMPQNPRLLFVKKSVFEELGEMVEELDNSQQRQEKLDRVIKLCRLEELLDRHPFDLSGGEAQRTALAKILLMQPKILLLDEPTKGMDGEYKKFFGGILKELCNEGVCVVAVSHDVEFCAEFCDRCAMLFNGEITGAGDCRSFFSQNSFYTTASSRMSRSIIPLAITAEDIMQACGVKTLQYDNFNSGTPIFSGRENGTQDSNRKGLSPQILASANQKPKLKSFTVRIFSLIFLVLIFLSAIECIGKNVFPKALESSPFFKYILLGLSASGFALLNSKSKKHGIACSKVKKSKPKKRTVATAVTFLVAIPFTVWLGVTAFDDRKYLFISLLVMLECMLPFFLVFEGRNPQARELVTVAVLTAIAVAGRGAFYMLPQFKPVIAVVIISGASFGGETGFLVGAMTMLASNVFFQQGPWTPWQMFAMGIIGFLSGLFFQSGILPANRGTMAAFGMICAVVIYGGIMNPASAIIAHIPLNKGVLLSYIATGLPMDIVQGTATMLFLFFGAEPMLEKLERIKIKYGMLE